ncbi:FUSC family protein [Cupriavidus pauculus]|uniref:FUSC family protein n=1 Tax=Cupriavidus pauculus TaxID=82633 RepID=UPI0007857EC8|nr:FUSC family protein [Cupriavidus pauculus]MBY4729249.1 FUSC family protein [Cupriavidus pauculus]
MAGWPHARQWLFSLKAFAAAMLALYIALFFGLPRPFWAMATVYFVSNPLTGATRSKATYRVLGTLLGATAAVVTVPQLVNMPIVLMGAIALWIMLLVYLSLLQRSPRSYVFLLAAYTLPIVALPAVMHPADIFDIAVARIEEIVIGIVCAALVGAIVFPANVASALRERTQVWLDDAAAWAADIVRANPRAAASRHRLAADMLALDQLIAQMSFDAGSQQTLSHARALRARMSRLMPVLSGWESVLYAMRGQPGHKLSHTALAETAAYLQTRQDALMQSCIALQRAIGDHNGTSRSASLAASGATQTAEAGETAEAAEAADAQALYHDHAMLLFGAASAGLAVFCAGLLWIFSGWEDGGGPVAVAAIACCFFATIDEPRPVARSFIRWATVCLLISSFYLFLVIPHAQTFEALTGMLAVPYLGIGMLITRPGFNLIAMLLSVNTASFANVQSVYDVNFVGLFNANLANAAAMVFAPLWAMLARPFGAHVAARRLIRASWQDLARAATWRGADTHTQVGARMLDRLGQLMPRLGASRGRIASDGFTELQIGYCTLALQRALPALPPHARKPVRRVLSIVARHFRARVKSGAPLVVPPALHPWIQASLAEMACLQDRKLAADVASALTVLDVTLQTHEKSE